jgi:putative tryptophan/tyrosine transport system substrate-binding protein
MERRKFIMLLGGAAAAAWPLAALAQRSERMRRIGVLVSGLAADDPEWQARGTAFVQGLQELGWADGRNVRVEYRFGLGDPDRLRKSAAELVALAPDVILAGGGVAVPALQQATRTLPIVFANVGDPVGLGLVSTLARPGGNTTGFMTVELGVSGKWLELLKQIAPRVTRVAVLRSFVPAGIGALSAIQAVAPSHGVELTPVGIRDADEIERGITAFARGLNDGLIVTGQLQRNLREAITALAARHRLPAIYPYRAFVIAGGLISYGPDQADPYRKAAGYVDRILKGEKPADLPVQAPTRFELVINLTTAKALGLTVPDTVLARADEVIE